MSNNILLLNNSIVDKLTPPKAIAFDLDLTLHNVIDHYHFSLNQTLLHFGFHALTDEELEQFGGDNYIGTREIFATILPKDLVDKAMKYYFDHFLNSEMSIKTLIPGSREILYMLKKRFNLPIIGVTNSDETIAKKILKDLHFTKLFDYVIGIKENTPLKPNPAMLLTALNYVKISSGPHVWFIGDMPSDVECAKNANCTAIRFYYKVNPHDPKADLNINNHYYLYNIISDKLKK